MKVDLHSVKKWLNADPRWGNPTLPEVTGISINSRTLEPGEIFFALRGPTFDGHHFVKESVAQGAGAVVVEYPMDVNVPCFVVRDTREALGQLASAYRQQFTLPMVGITGSCGKTTVREMTASILRQQGFVLATHGNRNNSIGVPLTLFDIRKDHDYAVIEMGTNMLGEIATISNWARPTVAAITNIAPAHLEGFGTIETILKEKSKIFASIPMNGTGVFPGLSEYAPYWRKHLKAINTLTFGDETCDVFARNIQLFDEYSTFELVTPSDKAEIKLQIPGRHHIDNALTAACCTYAMDVPMASIRGGLQDMKAVAGRFRIVRGINGIRLIDDSYNANFHSVNAALQQLARYEGERILVFGDMGELGDQSVHYHQRVGEVAKQLGIDSLFTVGELTRHTAETYGSSAQHYPNLDTLVESLIDKLHDQCTVLVKGSYSAGMSKVVEALQTRG